MGVGGGGGVPALTLPTYGLSSAVSIFKIQLSSTHIQLAQFSILDKTIGFVNNLNGVEFELRLTHTVFHLIEPPPHPLLQNYLFIRNIYCRYHN